MKKSILTGKKLQVLLHLFAWAILIILPQYLLRMNLGRNPFIESRLYLNTIIYGLIFYTNFFWLIPALFLKNKRLSYLFAAFAVVICFYFIMNISANYIHQHLENSEQVDERYKQPPKDNKGPKPPSKQFHLYIYALNAFLISGFSIGLRVSSKLKQNEEQRKELEKEKLNSELAFLKNQISPHFFFNTLNNIYSLIGINAADAQESVYKLSKLMRYLLYESEQGKTPLSREIDFMNNFIDLMRLRINEKVILKISFPSKYEDYAVPPLLFIPFIENAFKHGVSYRENSFIDIAMKVEDNNILFTCKNSLGRISEEKNLEHPGIGLENVKKRLNLLFPGKHQLNISQEATVYNVVLSLNMKNKDER